MNPYARWKYRRAIKRRTRAIIAENEHAVAAYRAREPRIVATATGAFLSVGINGGPVHPMTRITDPDELAKLNLLRLVDKPKG